MHKKSAGVFLCKKWIQVRSSRHLPTLSILFSSFLLLTSTEVVVRWEIGTAKLLNYGTMNCCTSYSSRVGRCLDDLTCA